MTRIKELVRNRYAQVAGNPCCSPEATFKLDLRAEVIGYFREELKGVPESAIELASGCGDPTASAELKEGESVLDLGSGGGIDAFIAARKVREKGRVIGVDMTPEMVKRARINAEKMGFRNIEFMLGDIEDLPIEDESVDVIISNCVINLSQDKSRVFEEAYRVLKHGGRIVISDIVSRGELPTSIREDVKAWVECVAGALPAEEYLKMIRDAGFTDLEVLSENTACCWPGASDTYSVKVRARKT
ncbi:arsenite methyltransferase [Candidatus Bathyarchaeota archaeon]|nr:arsenite methyltransferase [Candidatus Bathyarchaeota archaeon]